MATNEIKALIREARSIIEEVQKADGNEAETRRRVERIFESVLGYDAFKHLSREHAVHGVGDTEHMDFVIRPTCEQISMVVELKRVNVDLAHKHLKQAMRYAVDLGCEWFLLTNGRQWDLYHLEFGQPPETRLIKSWNLLQDDIGDLADNFEIISCRNLKRGALEELWKSQSALTPEALLSEILSEDSLRALKNAFRRNTGTTINPEDIVAAFRSLLNDASGTLMDQMKISLPERKARSAKKTLDSEVPATPQNANPPPPLATPGPTNR